MLRNYITEIRVTRPYFDACRRRQPTRKLRQKLPRHPVFRLVHHTRRLLGHASIQTTADIYSDWDIRQLRAETMRDVLAQDEVNRSRL